MINSIDGRYSVGCMDGAAGMMSLEHNTVKLVYGSPPYPNAERNYGVWKSTEYIEKIAPFIDGAKHVLRSDGFLVINVKANRERAKSNTSSKRSLVVEELALLNAFRYALFGTIQRRNGVLRSLKEMENIEARADGHYGFSVVLKMENDGVIYELTRQYAARKDIVVPSYEEDYEKLVYLKKNGSFLAEDQREHELSLIMPEQVSRFFLFDGELLQEYEELLENETSTGERITSSCGRIPPGT